MKIFITGGTGFVGSAFIRLALAQGHEILALVRNPETAFLQKPERLTLTQGDLQNPNWKEIEAFKPEICVHSAWIATPGVYLEFPENHQFLQWSIDLTHRCGELGVKHFVGLGTCIEYKIGNEPLSEETTPIEPTTLYAKCKNQFRLALVADATRQNYLYSWGRIFYPYGPGEHPSRLCSSIIQKLLRNEIIILKTPNSTKDYIYIDDLASAILTIVQIQLRGEVNLGAGHGISVGEIAETIAQQLKRPELIEKSEISSPDPFSFVVADVLRLHSVGWRPKVTVVEGIQRLIQNIRR